MDLYIIILLSDSFKVLVVFFKLAFEFLNSEIFNVVDQVDFFPVQKNLANARVCTSEYIKHYSS